VAKDRDITLRTKGIRTDAQAADAFAQRLGDHLRRDAGLGWRGWRQDKPLDAEGRARLKDWRRRTGAPPGSPSSTSCQWSRLNGVLRRTAPAGAR
jgi:hypothetical protein